NEGTNGSGRIEVTGSREWTPGWNRLMGAEQIYVDVNVSIDGSAPFNYSENSNTQGNTNWWIRGNNPAQTEIENQTNDYEAAMVETESCFEQFSNTAACGGNEPWYPNRGGNGWGLTQLDNSPQPTRIEVWDWQENLDVGVDRFNDNRDRAEGWNVTNYRRAENNPAIPDWQWNPENPNDVYNRPGRVNGLNTEQMHWTGAYLRYNSGYDSLLDRNGDMRNIDNETWGHVDNFQGHAGI
ncbi:MAG: hypothetical protein ABEH43_07480, partial [Flavobacteriales bacterium]